MASLSFPSSPVNGQLYPSSPLAGEIQYQWSSSAQTWALLGTASGAMSGTYGDNNNVGQFTVDTQGKITFAQNVPIASGAGGTVTSIATGTGLTGGPITGSGTISLAPATTTTLGGVIADGTSILISPTGIISAVGDGTGTVTAVTSGTGLSGGTITTSGTIDLADTTVAPGSYTYSSIPVDQQGRLTAAASGTTPVTAVTASSGLTSSGGVTPDISLSATAVTPGSYTNTSITVDAQGRLTAASSGSGSSGVTSITAGTGLTGGTITTSGTVALGDTAVSPGSYTYGSFTVDAQGRLTAASSGTSPITCLDFDTKGDLLAGFGSDSYGTVAIGTNGQVLTADSACSPGMKWGTITQCLGTVTSVTAGTGLNGGTITSTGTINLVDATPSAIGGVYGKTNTNSTALGVDSQSSTSVGSDNVSVGAYSLVAGSGSSNVAIGVSALPNLTSGSCNISIGTGSGLNTTSGIGNIGIGFQALICNTTGRNNLEIGANNSIGGLYSPPFQVTTECNRVVMGSTATTNAYIQVAWTVVSDERDKTEIHPIALGLDFVSQLDPISYRFKESRETEVATGPTRYGFLAQQVLEVEGENPVVVDIEDPNKLKITDANLIPILVQAIKDLKAEIEDLKK